MSRVTRERVQTGRARTARVMVIIINARNYMTYTQTRVAVRWDVKERFARGYTNTPGHSTLQSLRRDDSQVRSGVALRRRATRDVDDGRAFVVAVMVVVVMMMVV